MRPIVKIELETKEGDLSTLEYEIAQNKLAKKWFRLILDSINLNLPIINEKNIFDLETINGGGIQIDFENSNCIELEDDEFKYFSTDFNWGDLFVPYSGLGKSTLNSFYDCEKPYPQKKITSGLHLSFYNNISLNDRQKNHIQKWLLEKNLDSNFKNSSLGLLKVGRLLSNIDKNIIKQTKRVRRVFVDNSNLNHSVLLNDLPRKIKLNFNFYSIIDIPFEKKYDLNREFVTKLARTSIRKKVEYIELNEINSILPDSGFCVFFKSGFFLNDSTRFFDLLNEEALEMIKEKIFIKSMSELNRLFFDHTFFILDVKGYKQFCYKNKIYDYKKFMFHELLYSFIRQNKNIIKPISYGLKSCMLPVLDGDPLKNLNFLNLCFAKLKNRDANYIELIYEKNLFRNVDLKIDHFDNYINFGETIHDIFIGLKFKSAQNYLKDELLILLRACMKKNINEASSLISKFTYRNKARKLTSNRISYELKELMSRYSIEFKDLNRLIDSSFVVSDFSLSDLLMHNYDAPTLVNLGKNLNSLNFWEDHTFENVIESLKRIGGEISTKIGGNAFVNEDTLSLKVMLNSSVHVLITGSEFSENGWKSFE